MLGNRTDDASAELVRLIIAQNPDRKIQGRACKALAEGRRKAARLADRLKADDRLRQTVEQQAGQEYVARLIANADKAKQEAEVLSRMVREKYADVVPVLAVGQPIPEVVSRDLDGKEVRLSALKGQVVVLIIWSTNSEHSRSMLPHLRKMVSRLKDKPFVLVGINADEKQTLTDFLAREKMPWTHWWTGPRGGILEDWEIQYFPVIYVLDARGVIRYKDLRDDKLEDAVYDLLREVK
jgi:peroxiredoxin